MLRELEINNASQDYIITEYNHKYILFRKDVKSGFESGAKWAFNEFRKDLWHSTEEKPEKEKVFLYQSSCYGFGLNQISDTKDWNYIIKYQKAIQWLYIDDLLPKEGDE